MAAAKAMALTASLTASAVLDPARFGRDVERQTFRNPLTVDLDEPVCFSSHPGSAIAAARAGVLHHNLRWPIFDHNRGAIRTGMPQLDKVTTAGHAQAPRLGPCPFAHFPAAAFQLIEHSERSPGATGRRCKRQQGSSSRQANLYVQRLHDWPPLPDVVASASAAQAGLVTPRQRQTKRVFLSTNRVHSGNSNTFEQNAQSITITPASFFMST